MTRAPLDQAYENMRLLLADSRVVGARFRRDLEAIEEPGYFAFLVTVPDPETGRTRCLEVHMPADENARFLDPRNVPKRAGRAPGEVYLPPRIYIDDASWWWPFAASALQRAVSHAEAAP